MSGHTPGPWSVYERGHSQVRPGIEAEDLSFSIAVYGCKEDSNGIFGRTPEEAKSNARLIAAAPELLEACIAASRGEHRAHELIRSAIAKAVSP